MRKGRLSSYWSFLKHLVEINWRIAKGMWQLTRLPQPAITVFGGSRIPKESKYAQQACELAKKLAADGFSIITGGGPGIMEAANLGAYQFAQSFKEGEKKTKPGRKKRSRELTSLGIGVSRLNKENRNPYAHDYIEMDHFFTRKWLLVRYSVGFAVFPGGFGTMDELFELVTLIQTERMPLYPIALIGKDYWQPLMDWIINRWKRDGLISDGDEDIIKVFDDVDEAFTFITTQCRKCEDR